MKRKASLFLEKWLVQAYRKPLVIRGARQVGKTWLVRDFAASQGKQLIEINFEKERQTATLFESNNPQEILLNLSEKVGRKIQPHTSILFLDEIQAAPTLYEKLRWFAEDMPELPVIAAGSLLEVIVMDNVISMPVGRINYMYLEPLSFEEFLEALGHEILCESLQRVTFASQIPLYTHEHLSKLLKEYIIVGGMPIAINVWKDTQSLEAVGQSHQDLLKTYRDDFRIYSGRLAEERLDEVFTKVPLLLGKKFIYRDINKDVRIPAIKKSLELLCKARVCHKIEATAANGLPLGAEVHSKYFKTIFLDIGLCSSMLKLSLSLLRTTEEIDLINSGGIAEQLVGQALRTLPPFYEEPSLYYWLKTDSQSNAEIDYVIHHGTNIVPIEVKAGLSGRLKSLHLFMQLKKRSYAVRVSSAQMEARIVKHKGPDGRPVEYTLYTVPFYLLEQINRLLDNQSS